MNRSKSELLNYFFQQRFELVWFSLRIISRLVSLIDLCTHWFVLSQPLCSRICASSALRRTLRLTLLDRGELSQECRWKFETSCRSSRARESSKITTEMASSDNGRGERGKQKKKGKRKEREYSKRTKPEALQTRA